MRGLAVRFDNGNGAISDLVMISAPVFFAQTPALFVELLQTLASKDQDKVKAFFQAHPESTRQNAWLTSHPVPASYAGVDYFGMHAFTFTNARARRSSSHTKPYRKPAISGSRPMRRRRRGPIFMRRN